MKEKSSFLKLTLAALLGASGACMAILFPEIPIFIKFLLLYVGISAGMIRIAFSYKGLKKFCIHVFILYFICFFVGGGLSFILYRLDLNQFLNQLSRQRFAGVTSFVNLICAVGVFCILIPACLRIVASVKDNYTNIYAVTIVLDGKVLYGKGFVDTGNGLVDAHTKDPVVIAEYEWINKILTNNQKDYLEQFMKIGETDFKDYEEPPILVRMIPFHSIGENHGLLPAVKVDQIMIENGKYTKEAVSILVGIYYGKLSNHSDYQLLLHKELT